MPRPKYQEQTVELPAEFIPGKIGVVTVTYGSGEVLPDFFASLDKQVYRNFMLVAVDNQSQDSTLDQLRAYKGCELILIPNDKNLGVATGNNQGIRAAIQAGCEYVLLLNNDVVFGAELFQQLVDGLAEHNCQMTTPIMYYHDRANVIWAAGGYFQPLLGYRSLHYGDGDEDAGQHASAKPVAYTPTCCVLVQREVFARIGLMDERYFVYSDDTDFMLRAWKAGLKLWLLPQVKLWHKVSSLTGTGSLFRTHYVYRNRAFYLTKHCWAVAIPFFTLAYRLHFALRRLLGKDKQEVSERKRSAWKEGLSIEG